MRRLRAWRVVDWIAASLLVAATLGGGLAVWWLTKHALAVRRLHTQGVGDTTFTWADGRPWFRLDEQRQDVPLSEISPWLRQAVIAVEDHRFYRHAGIDPVGVGRAVWVNVSTDEVHGASTLTQQLARTLFLSNRRTWTRKFEEAALSIVLEQQLTKDEILELYLNRIYLSSGVYGVEPLARRLFGKPSADLTLPEAALIAGLIRSPSALSPWTNLDGAMERARVVLTRMRDEGYITTEQQRQAAGSRPRIRPYSVAVSGANGYAKEYVRQRFRDEFGGDRPPDWSVRSTFLPRVQEAAERAVANGLRRLGRRDLQAALVAIEASTGDVVAMVGGRDFVESPFNRAVRARRQPGSTFKPFVFAAALAGGWSPVAHLSGLDEVAIPDDAGQEWSPRNVSTKEASDLTLREALVESNNRAAAALQQQVGTRRVLRLASDAGLGDQPDVPSLALGTGLVSPLELARGYGVFASGGWRVEPRGILQVVDGDGDVVLDQRIRRVRSVSPAVAFQVTSMLEDVVNRGTGNVVRSHGLSLPVAGKTGTTNEFKDAWFAGYSSSLVTVVWVGYDQPATLGREAFGAKVAGPIWSEFMRSAARAYPPKAFKPPGDVRAVALCRVSYTRPVSACPTYSEYLKLGDAEPERLCPLHHGTVKQEARKAVEGMLGWLLRRVFGGGGTQPVAESPRE
jgi:1A family penicillin-binding protein